MLDPKYFGLSNTLVFDVQEAMKKKKKSKNPEIIINPEIGPEKTFNLRAEGKIAQKVAYGVGRLLGKSIRVYANAVSVGLFNKKLPYSNKRIKEEITFQTSLVKKITKTADDLAKKKKIKIDPSKPIGGAKPVAECIEKAVTEVAEMRKLKPYKTHVNEIFGFGKKKERIEPSFGSTKGGGSAPEVKGDHDHSDVSFKKGASHFKKAHNRLVKGDPARATPAHHFAQAAGYERHAQGHEARGDHDSAKTYRKFRDNSLHRYVMHGGDVNKINFKEDFNMTEEEARAIVIEASIMNLKKRSRARKLKNNMGDKLWKAIDDKPAPEIKKIKEGRFSI